MKKIIAILIIIPLLCCCVNQGITDNRTSEPEYPPMGEYPGSLDHVSFGDFPQSSKKSGRAAERIAMPEPMKGIWVSYGDLQIKGMGKKQYTDYIKKTMSSIADFGFNTVFFHVRPFCDSLYRSKIFPTSHILTGEQGSMVDYDPLEIAIKEAHDRGLSFHAWINPMRVLIKNGDSTLPKRLSGDSFAAKWLKEDSPNLLNCESGVYLNIAEQEALNKITDGIEEIVMGYDVDGIHFDDYFYPSDCHDADHSSYDRYVEKSGEISKTEFRINNVDNMIKRCHKAVKDCKKDVLFGVSPSGNISNLREMGVDISHWVKNEGYVDYLIPQIYFGFDNEALSFDSAIKRWCDIELPDSVRLYIGLAGYKTGSEDKYARGGKDEWSKKGDILKRQTEKIMQNKSISGICIFDYDSMFEKTQSDVRLSERRQLKKTLVKWKALH